MKLRTTLYSFAAVLLLGSISLIGCTTEDQPGTGSDGITRVGTTTSSTMEVGNLTEGQRYVFAVKGGSGTVIKGLSSNGSTSIVVSWTRGGGDVGIDSIFYKKVDVATSTLTVDGTVYTAQTWATAKKFGPFTLYETAADQAHVANSGLMITSSGVSTVSAFIGADANNADVVLMTNNSIGSPFLTLGSGYRNNTSAHQTEFASTVGLVTGGASADWYNTGFLSLSFSKDNVWNVPSAASLPLLSGDAMMIPIRTVDNHYARIEVLSGENPSVPGEIRFFQYSNDNLWRTITVNVYYQTVAGLDYATPHGADNGGH